MINWRSLFRSGRSQFDRKTQVLLVCRENICRSPMAEGLLRAQLHQVGLGRQVTVRSAGTQTTQPGRRPDQRAERAAALGGISLSRMRARLVDSDDLIAADLILAMDESNRQDLLQLCPAEHQHKIHLLLEYSPGQHLVEVPDPYYGSTEGFEDVFKVLEGAVRNLVPHIGTLIH